MSRYGYKKENKLIKSVRDLTAFDDLTIDQLRAELFKLGFCSAMGTMLDKMVVWRYIRKAEGQAVAEVDRAKINRRMAKAEDRFKLSMSALAKIAFWKWDYLDEGIACPSPGERIMACRSIIEKDLDMFKAELLAGIFEKELGSDSDVVEAIRNRPLSDEWREKLSKAFNNLMATHEPVVYSPESRQQAKHVEGKVVDAKPKQEEKTEQEKLMPAFGVLKRDAAGKIIPNKLQE